MALKCRYFNFDFSHVTIINSTTLQIIYEVPSNNNDKGEIYGPVRACRFCPNGKVLAKGHDTGIIEVRCKKHKDLGYKLGMDGRLL